MRVLLAMLLSLCLLFGGIVPSSAATDSGVGGSAAPIEPVPTPPADVGPLPTGSEGTGLGVKEIAIGTVVVAGAFAIGLATEGGLAAAIASGAAVLLIYSILP